ncbi:MAG: DUF4157 domain-containing protein [Nitrospirota bacterium]
MVQAKPIAEQITSLVQKQAEDEETIMPKAILSGTRQVNDRLQNRLNRGSGQPLPEAYRSFVERRFGVDFSDVRVHTDSNAVQMSRELNAEAFTHGRDIYLGAGRYSPDTSSGRRLIAHELTHVVQQSGKMISHPVIQRRVLVYPDTDAINDILIQFNTLCPGSWSYSGQSITGKSIGPINSEGCECINDTVNDPKRIYTINIAPVVNSPRKQRLHDGREETIPSPSPWGPYTNSGENPTIYMNASSSKMKFGAFSPTGTVIECTNWRILGHELCGHGRLKQSYSGSKGNRPDHNKTIDTENAIAAEHGEPPRGKFENPRQGESFHRALGDPKVVFALVDGWYYEEPSAPLPPAPVTGETTASALWIREEPSTSSPIRGSYPRGTIIKIWCQIPGTEVEGNPIWDRTNRGYVSDQYVELTEPRQPPKCWKEPPSEEEPKVPVTGRTTASALRIRQEPDTSSTILGLYPRGSIITIWCKTSGTEVEGNPIWDRTNRGYVSDQYVEHISTGKPPNC